MALTLHGTVANNTAVLSRPNAKPLVINGDMNIAQRATSLTGYTGGAGYTTLDRWRFDVNTLGTWTIAQTASSPDNSGLINSFRVDCTTADASPASGDFAIFSTRLEGQDFQMFKKGTSNTEKMTVSFYVKSNKTGTYIMEIDDNDNARNINQAYTISSANTWEKKVLTFAGDTSGALGNDNGDSLRLLWFLGAGSGFTSSSLQTSWAGTDNTKRAVGQVNLADSTANDWSITGIQLEVGEFDANSIAPFQHESYGDSLVRCQRYCQTWQADHTNDLFCTGMSYGSTLWLVNLQMKTTMRTPPSVTFSAPNRFYVHNNVAGAIACTTIAATNLTPNTGMVLGAVAGGLTAGNANNLLAQGADTKITATAEL